MISAADSKLPNPTYPYLHRHSVLLVLVGDILHVAGVPHRGVYCHLQADLGILNKRIIV